MKQTMSVVMEKKDFNSFDESKLMAHFGVIGLSEVSF